MRKDSILHYIRDYAQTQPDKYAVCELRKNLTYREYWEKIRKTASVLADNQIEKQMHVVVRCTQTIDYLVLFSALQYIGAVPVPVEKTLGADRIMEIAGAVDASVVIADEEITGIRAFKNKELMKAVAEANEAELPLPAASDISMILFTTGTTGKSKGVVLTHLNDVAIAENVMYGTQMAPDNVEVIPMPLNHAFGMRRYQSDIVNGGTVCLMDGMVFMGTLWKLMEKYHVTSMALSPASLGMIFQLSGDRIGEYKDQMHYIQIGSAPLMEADKQHLIKLMPNLRLYNFYGSSEAGCSCILDFNSPDNKTGCIGRPTVNSIVQFVDENGNKVENVDEEHPALLAWGGPIVMKEYYKEPQLTAETMTDGCVMTKDMAYLDEEGRCILVGRSDDIVNYGGSKIAPAEVEDCARDYEGIADCAYSSRPDAITGELPVMLVVKNEGYDQAAFEAFLAERLESYKMPREYYFTDSIPKTFKGSLLRKDIKKIINEQIEGGNQ